MSVQANTVQSAGPPPGPTMNKSGGPALQPGMETAFAAAMGAWLALLQALDTTTPTPLTGSSSPGNVGENGATPVLQVVDGQGMGLHLPEGLTLRTTPMALSHAALREDPQAGATPALSPEGNKPSDPVLVGQPMEAGMVRPGTRIPTGMAEGITQSGGFQIQAEGARPVSTVEVPQTTGADSAGRTASQETPLLPGGAVPVAGPTTPVQTETAGKPPAAEPTTQIADGVQAAVERGEREATLRLNPPDLGRVHIRLQVHDGRLHLSIRAEHAETGHLIDQRLADLREGLTLRGLHVGEIRVDAEKVNSFEPISRAMRPGQMDLGGDLSRQGQQQQPHPGAFAAMADGRGSERGWSRFVAPSGEREDEAAIRRVIGPVGSLQRSGLTLQGIDTYA